ncbi:MAG: metallophosphoesterase, partial [Myxococcales bacterium]|nr:metallophosphoesterase [Myxococcales bacterium]
TDAEWAAADDAMALLDGVIPYAMATGNHDMGSQQNLYSRNTAPFDRTFPKSRFMAMGTSPESLSATSMANSHHRFEAGGIRWLVLVLEYGPRDSVLTWAKGVVDAHPDHQVIVLTHTYLYADSTLHGSKASHRWVPSQKYPGGANDGVDMWQKLVRKSSNIAMVLNGHVGEGGAGRLVSRADDGHSVYQMLANFQEIQPSGGDGWLRLLTFDPGKRTLQVRTYSPHLAMWDRTPTQEFTYWDFEPLRPLDGTPPGILGAQWTSDTTLEVTFDERIDLDDAGDATNYSVTGCDIEAAIPQPNGRVVDLTVAVPPSAGRASLTVDGIADSSPAKNPMTKPYKISIEDR